MYVQCQVMSKWCPGLLYATIHLHSLLFCAWPIAFIVIWIYVFLFPFGVCFPQLKGVIEFLTRIVKWPHALAVKIVNLEPLFCCAKWRHRFYYVTNGLNALMSSWTARAETEATTHTAWRCRLWLLSCMTNNTFACWHLVLLRKGFGSCRNYSTIKCLYRHLILLFILVFSRHFYFTANAYVWRWFYVWILALTYLFVMYSVWHWQYFFCLCLPVTGYAIE